MNTLRKKIGIGYAVISIVIAAIVYIGVGGWHRQAHLNENYQRTEELQRQVRDVNLRIVRLSLMGEAVINWEQEDLETYHARRLELDSVLREPPFNGRGLRAQTDSLRTLLENKEEHLRTVMELLGRQDSLGSQIARQVPVIARRSTQEEPRKGRRKILGLFGARRQPKQTATTSMLYTLDRKVISRHREQSRRLEEFADSLADRNRQLNAQLESLVRRMDEKAQEDMNAWEDETDALKRQNYYLIGGLSALVILLLLFSYILVYRSVARARRYKQRKAELIASLEGTVKENGELISSRRKFMQTVTHELRTPLSAISGYAELLQGAEDEDKRTRYIRSIRTSAGRMSAMLNTLLSFFRLESGKESVAKVPFTLKNMASTLGTEFLPLAETKGIELSVKCDKDIVLMGDKERILQIGDNLLSNAVKFTEEGSVSLSIGYENGMLVLVVEDTGTGMGEEDRKRIFHAFERLSNAATQDGFGLGLSIVKRTADLLGGTISVESEKGKGSRFTVELPMETADALPQKEKEKAHTHDFGKSMSVIVLDDNEPLLMMTKEMLETNGISCDTVCSVSDLVDAMRGHRYDLLITDMKMPETNGYEVLELLRTSNIGNSKDIPVVVATASGSCTEGELLGRGFAGCLFKPFQIEALLDVCGECVRKEYRTAIPDFSALLSWGDKAAMLDKVVESTEKEMRLIREAAEANDTEALHDMIHHLRSSWMVMRTEKPLQRLHDALGNPEEESEFQDAVSAVLAAGEAIITNAKEERRKHDGTDSRG